MRFLATGLLALSLTVVVAERGYAACGDAPGDAAAVAAARAQVEADCPCGGFPNHGQYVRCAAGVAKARADADLLPKSCKGAVVKCAAKSTCGKPGFVTCCRTSASGVTKCSTKKDASKCTAPKNGSACVSSFSSCCDACTETGCASPSGAFLDGPSASHF
jgi:hypothetical protein